MAKHRNDVHPQMTQMNAEGAFKEWPRRTDEPLLAAFVFAKFSSICAIRG
jgi:hypothetical protein